MERWFQEIVGILRDLAGTLREILRVKRQNAATLAELQSSLTILKKDVDIVLDSALTGIARSISNQANQLAANTEAIDQFGTQLEAITAIVKDIQKKITPAEPVGFAVTLSKN